MAELEWLNHQQADDKMREILQCWWTFEMDLDPMVIKIKSPFGTQVRYRMGIGKLQEPRYITSLSHRNSKT
jgi:hypothetical protein